MANKTHSRRAQGEQGSPIERLNLGIAELIRGSKPEEIVEVMLGQETSLLRVSQQQQQQQQQQRRATLSDEPVLE